MLKPISSHFGAVLSKARAEYVALSVADIEAHPNAYKASVRADPTGAALQVIEGLDDREIRQLTADLRAEIAQVARLTA